MFIGLFRLKWQLVFLLPVFLASCATVPAGQGRVRRLSASGDLDHAAQVFFRLPEGVYGRNNRLLEAMDRGMIYHYAGRYPESIAAFEAAKQIHEELYTRSVSRMAASWLWNDAALPYPGEDFERAMINVVQALNFTALGRRDDALVEARNATATLQRLNDRYPSDRKNAYHDDAFVRLLAGILYESSPDWPQRNDAFISYTKAWELYNGFFKAEYALDLPELLKENLLAAAAWMGDRDRERFRALFGETRLYTAEFRREHAEVYILYFRGQIVNKVQSTLILPGMDGLITRISFPRYRRSFRMPRTVTVRAAGADGSEYTAVLERVQDLDAIARSNLDDRRLRILAMAVARPVTKQILVEALEDGVSHQAGNTAASVFRLAGNMYLLYSEEADLRSWETLPSEIYLGRLFLPAGDYRFFEGDKAFSKLSLPAGEKKIIIHWIR